MRTRSQASTGRVLAAGGAVAVATGLSWRHLAGRRSHGSWSPPGGRLIDGPLAGRVVGEGPPSMLLLHGMFSAGRYWGARFDELATTGSLVVPDLLGFGRSPRPPSGYTADAHADAVADTLRRLGATRSVVVGAHSVGSIVALRLALRHPHLVAAIVAFAPPIYETPEAGRAQIASVDHLARLFLANAQLGERVCALMCRHRHIAALAVRAAEPSLPSALAHDRVEHSWSSYADTLSNLVLAAEAPDWLAQIGVPVHLVAGSSDEAVDIDWLRQLEQHHRHVTLDVIDGAAHDLPLSHSGTCLELLRGARGADEAASSPLSDEEER